MANLKRKDTPESREFWDYAERVTREVEAEIERERLRPRWVPVINGYVCSSCGTPRKWDGTAWVNASHGPMCISQIQSDASSAQEVS